MHSVSNPQLVFLLLNSLVACKDGNFGDHLTVQVCSPNAKTNDEKAVVEMQSRKA